MEMVKSMMGSMWGGNSHIERTIERSEIVRRSIELSEIERLCDPYNEVIPFATDHQLDYL